LGVSGADGERGRRGAMGNNTENTEALIIEEAREERTSVRLGVLVLAALLCVVACCIST
jgi:hypothetical protein